MTHELIYTSAPVGLKPGSQGYCTVATTQGIAPPLVSSLESLCGYTQLFPPGTPRERDNPVNWAHYRLTVGGRDYSILSRVAAYGVDYTRRNNKLAHHVAVEAGERSPDGPAAALQAPGFVETSWEGEPRLLGRGRPVPAVGVKPRICSHWASTTGDAGWAGVVAESILTEPSRPIFLLFDPGMDLLPLMGEVASLLPAARRWEFTFSTYSTTLPLGVRCQCRCLVKGSAEANESRRHVQALRVDLTAPLPAASGGPLVEVARTGASSSTTEPIVFGSDDEEKPPVALPTNEPLELPTRSRGHSKEAAHAPSSVPVLAVGGDVYEFAKQPPVATLPAAPPPPYRRPAWSSRLLVPLLAVTGLAVIAVAGWFAFSGRSTGVPTVASKAAPQLVTSRNGEATEWDVGSEEGVSLIEGEMPDGWELVLEGESPQGIDSGKFRQGELVFRRPERPETAVRKLELRYHARRSGGERTAAVSRLFTILSPPKIEAALPPKTTRRELTIDLSGAEPPVPGARVVIEEVAGAAGKLDFQISPDSSTRITIDSPPAGNYTVLCRLELSDPDDPAQVVVKRLERNVALRINPRLSLGNVRIPGDGAAHLVQLISGGTPPYTVLCNPASGLVDSSTESERMLGQLRLQLENPAERKPIHLELTVTDEGGAQREIERLIVERLPLPKLNRDELNLVVGRPVNWPLWAEKFDAWELDTISGYLPPGLSYEVRSGKLTGEIQSGGEPVDVRLTFKRAEPASDARSPASGMDGESGWILPISFAPPPMSFRINRSDRLPRELLNAALTTKERLAVHRKTPSDRTVPVLSEGAARDVRPSPVQLTSIELITPDFGTGGDKVWGLQREGVSAATWSIVRVKLPGSAGQTDKPLPYFRLNVEALEGGCKLSLETLENKRVEEDSHLPGLQMSLLELQFSDGSSRLVPMYEPSSASFSAPQLFPGARKEGNLANTDRREVQELLAGLWPTAKDGPEWRARLETRVSALGEWKDLQPGPRSELKLSEIELFRESGKEPHRLNPADVIPLDTVVPDTGTSFPGMSKEDQTHPCALPHQSAADPEKSGKDADTTSGKIVFPRLQSLHLVLQAKWTEAPQQLAVATVIQIEVPQTGLSEGVPKPVWFFGLDGYRKWLDVEIESLTNRLNSDSRNSKEFLIELNTLKTAVAAVGMGGAALEDKSWCDLWRDNATRAPQPEKEQGKDNGSPSDQSKGGGNNGPPPVNRAKRALADYYDEYLKLERLVRIRKWLEERRDLKLNLEVESAFDLVRGRPELGTCRRRLISTGLANTAGTAR